MLSLAKLQSFLICEPATAYIDALESKAVQEKSMIDFNLMFDKRGSHWCRNGRTDFEYQPMPSQASLLIDLGYVMKICSIHSIHVLVERT